MARAIVLTDDLELLLEDVARLTNLEANLLTDAEFHDRQAQSYRERAEDARRDLQAAQIRLAEVIVDVPVSDNVPEFNVGDEVMLTRTVNYLDEDVTYRGLIVGHVGTIIRDYGDGDVAVTFDIGRDEDVHLVTNTRNIQIA